MTAKKKPATKKTSKSTNSTFTVSYVAPYATDTTEYYSPVPRTVESTVDTTSKVTVNSFNTQSPDSERSSKQKIKEELNKIKKSKKNSMFKYNPTNPNLINNFRDAVPVSPMISSTVTYIDDSVAKLNGKVQEELLLLKDDIENIDEYQSIHLKSILNLQNNLSSLQKEFNYLWLLAIGEATVLLGLITTLAINYLNS